MPRATGPGEYLVPDEAHPGIPRYFRHLDVPRADDGCIEYFRRRPILRSPPTHLTLLVGPQALVYRGPRSLPVACGLRTPFEKFRATASSFFNAPFATFTFFHHLEHLVHHDLPFSLYTDVAREVPVVDRDGQRRTMRTYVFTSEAIGRRRFPVLEAALHSRHLIARCRVGRSELLAVRVRAVIDCVREMSHQGTYFYDLSQTSDKRVASHSVTGADTARHPPS
jgi:hypothetical protein